MMFFLVYGDSSVRYGKEKFAICSPYERSLNYVSKISSGCFTYISSIF